MGVLGLARLASILVYEDLLILNSSLGMLRFMRLATIQITKHRSPQSPRSMNYAELDTASDILEAFDNCNNAGEEIELFEYLATRPNSPVGAFVSILNEVQLEPVLVLTIKAFGMITNRDLKELWQQNDVVLKLLSEKAKSGASDLIRWTAAVAIDAIGFGIVEISRHLPEKPVKIAERIVESKRKILIDYDDKSKGEQKITDRNDYRSFIDFWVYGATYDLRAITAKYRSKNSSIVVAEVVKAQSIYGIKETNKLLQKAEDRDYPDELTNQIYQNDLFEGFTYHLSTKLLQREDPPGFEHLVENQGHSLQSEDAKIRMKAASIILEINKNALNHSIPQGTKLLQIANAMNDCDFNLGTDFYYRGLVYEKLAEIIANLRIAKDLVSRDGVVKHFSDYLNKLSMDLSRLSPGLSWQQIQELAEKERREEAARQNLEREAQAERDRIARKAREEREERERADVARRQAERKAREERDRADAAKREAERKAAEERKRADAAQYEGAKKAAAERQRLAQIAEEERLATLKSIGNGVGGCLSIVLFCGVIAIPFYLLSNFVNYAKNLGVTPPAEQAAYENAQAIEDATPAYRVTGTAGVGYNELYTEPNRNSSYSKEMMIMQIVKVLAKSRDKEGILWYKIDIKDKNIHVSTQADSGKYSWIRAECITYSTRTRY